MPMWMAATMLGLNPDGGCNEHELNQWYKRMALILHPDTISRNGYIRRSHCYVSTARNARDISSVFI